MWLLRFSHWSSWPSQCFVILAALDKKLEGAFIVFIWGGVVTSGFLMPLTANC